jgi:hypothetical protein
VVRVVSKAGFETEPGEEPDLVVSTIPLEEAGEESAGASAAPASVVVSPLLREADVRRLGRVLAALGPSTSGAS